MNKGGTALIRPLLSKESKGLFYLAANRPGGTKRSAGENLIFTKKNSQEEQL
jgi:hypothetical protein